MSKLRIEQGEGLVRAFNEQWPPGTPVTLVNDDGEHEQTVTRSKAWCLGHGEPVVSVEGRSGGYLLSRIIPHRVISGHD